MAMAPVLDSVLSRYMNTDSATRAMTLGYAQVQKMVKDGDAVPTQTPSGEDLIISKIYVDKDGDVSEDQARSIVSKGTNGKDLSSVGVQEGSPGDESGRMCISVSGTICLGYEVNRGYPTFYVRSQDTDAADEDRKYYVVSWTDDTSDDDQHLVVTDRVTGEFVDVIDDASSFGRYVENAYKVSMDEDMSLSIQAPRTAKRTVYRPSGKVGEIDVEDVDEDPADVADMPIALVAQEATDYGSITHDEEHKVVSTEGCVALAGARDKGFLKEGGTVMMPEEKDQVSVIELESLFD